MTIGPDGLGEIAFGALQATLDVDDCPDEIGLMWSGSDEMDEVGGAGPAELQEDGSLLIEFSIHLGDDGVFKAVRQRA